MLGTSGKLDEALQHYLAALRISRQLRQSSGGAWHANNIESATYQCLATWAARPGQTPERIAAALDQIEKLSTNLPSWNNEFKYQHFEIRRAIAGDPEAIGWLGLDEEKTFRFLLQLRLMPWERARRRRLLDHVTRNIFQRTQRLESLLASGRKVEIEFYEQQNIGSAWPGPPNVHSWEYRFFDRHYGWQYISMSVHVLDTETRRRAARLLLAIQAWKLEHGEYPETLDVLVGPYLATLPLDPYTAEPFRYFPEGLACVTVRPDQRHERPPPNIEPNTPLLWSAGPLVSIDEVSEPLLDHARIRGHHSSLAWTTPTVEEQIWYHGWPFPLL